MAALAQHLPDARQIRFRQTLEPRPPGFEVHGHEDRQVVEQGRQNRIAGDLQIARAQELGHHESGCPHDRRHQLPPGRRDRLDGAGKGRTIAGTHHQRNREGAGGHHVGDRAARDGAEQGTGDHGDLCGPTGGVTRQREREIHEELPGTTAFDEGAEQDEQHHVGGRHIERNAEDALGRQVELIEHHADRLIAHGQSIGEESERRDR